MALDRLWVGNARPSPKNTSAVYAEDVNPIIDKLNSLESSTHAQHSDDQDLSGLLTLDQTTPQTFINGIPALPAGRLAEAAASRRLVHRFIRWLGHLTFRRCL